jgi:hypothetical protein
MAHVVVALQAAQVLSFLDKFEDCVRTEHAALLDSIRSRREITRGDLEAIIALARGINV